MNHGDDFWFKKWERFLKIIIQQRLGEELQSIPFSISQELYLLSQSSPEVYFSVIFPCYPVQQRYNQRDSHCSSLDQMLVMACAGSSTWTNS